LSLRETVERSFTFSAIEATFRLICPPRPGAARLSAVFRDAEGRRHVIYFGTKPPATGDGALAALRGVLAEAFERTRAVGSRLLVVFVPIKFRVHRDMVEAPDEAEWVEWSLDDQLPARMGRMLGSISPEVGFVDLTGPFQERARAGGIVYLPDDTHWSAEGHRVAAEALIPLLGKGRP
jgi:hypothetical protein